MIIEKAIGYAARDPDDSAENHGPAFTLIEVLVVVAVIALLTAVLLPGLTAAREQAKAVVCRSNLSQILAANSYYAENNRGTYVPGAADFLTNLHRWHGTRGRTSEPFDSARGPLVPYLGPEGAIRQCPAFAAAEIAAEGGGFERGAGGYGYNNAFIGTQVVRQALGAYVITDDRAGATRHHVARPADTVMFADAAFSGRRIIEYSFAEPRFNLRFPEFRMDPSIHFRHRDQANVGWCDGHVESRRRTFTWSSGVYTGDPDRLSIGWFGEADDNSLFDLE